ncbi:class I glutamine amidotransferase-like protein [Coniochaeta ligniaria NRRL 30616]|uniref:Class I glutamine amidotransferase-like protein n=1 Tax=Coniochaeta ligniaria NRRL 30616 TaxID=1408157 RepID=A0A1J7JJA0_9PEZI|nr:class I glutamine amidotransferase-like protein [Coniochaeta ligniaria NRRL 30616]
MSAIGVPLGVLVFSKTTGFRHDSIPAGISAFQRLANQSQSGEATLPRPFTVTATEDASVFTDAGLSKFGVIVLLQTSGDFLTEAQLEALKVFVHAGGGVVAVHCASTGMPSHPWYGRMIGAVFTDHPEPQHGMVTIEDPGHGIIRGTLGKGKGNWHNLEELAEPGSGRANARWECFDEWYNYARNPRSVGGIHVLYSVDETTYKGGKHGQDHPIAWCQEFEGGRSFYTALGHFDQAYSDEAFLGQLLNAIAWTSCQLD